MQCQVKKSKWKNTEIWKAKDKAMDTNTRCSQPNSLETHLVRKWGDIEHQRVLGNALFIFWSSLSWLRPALVADLSARPPRGTFWCHILALPPDRKGLSRLWVPLFGMIFPLNFVFCRGTLPVLFINSSRLPSLAEPELGAPLSIYLEGALYKLIYR